MSRVLRNDVKAVINCVGSSPFIKPRHLRISSVSTGISSPCLFNRQGSLEVQRIYGITPRVTFRRAYSNSHVRGQSAPPQKSDDTPGDANAPTPPLAIVFTDIVKSTALWEKDSPSMSEAMDIHDNLVRNLATRYDGYEVKQNGDGFMFAFQSAISALNFCLNTQINLQEQEWPKTLLELGPAEPITKVQGEPDGKEPEEVVLWKGLRMRMSAHYGEPVCKYNEVIGRMDYLGPAVNRAARFVSVCEGGQIVVSEDFLDELRRARRDVVGGGGPLFDAARVDDVNAQDLDLAELQGEDLSQEMNDTKFELRMLGERHFKGVPDKQKLFFILPKSLRGRLDYLPKQKYVQPSKGNLIEGG